jgi:hypothetical protein
MMNIQGCHVHAIARNYGALTAQNRQSLLEDTGFSFVKCRVTGSGALYLGRAWGTFSRVVFAYTYMDNIIIPRGWYNWGDPTREMSVLLLLPPSPAPPVQCMKWNHLTRGAVGSIRVQDGVLRAVQVHGAGRELRRQGAMVAGAHRRGGQALHLARLHRRLPVAPVVARLIVDTHTPCVTLIS